MKIRKTTSCFCSCNCVLGVADTKAIANYIDHALENAEKVEYILRTLRSFNLYETPELQDIAMSPFLDKFISIVREDFENKGIIITADAGNAHVYADPRVLDQVMLNIFTNAADAFKDREKPAIRVSVLTADMVQIRIEDNGCGIAEDKLKDLFKPFHTSKAHGTGLGLMIVKKMLTMMNGTVEISSSMGKGTTVNVRLPAMMQ